MKLQEKSVKELKEMGKSLGINKWWTLPKETLITEIENIQGKDKEQMSQEQINTIFEEKMQQNKEQKELNNTDSVPKEKSVKEKTPKKKRTPRTQEEKDETKVLKAVKKELKENEYPGDFSDNDKKSLIGKLADELEIIINEEQVENIFKKLTEVSKPKVKVDKLKLIKCEKDGMIHMIKEEGSTWKLWYKYRDLGYSKIGKPLRYAHVFGDETTDYERVQKDIKFLKEHMNPDRGVTHETLEIPSKEVLNEENVQKA